MILSVIVPTYNSSITLKKCLDSIILQNIQDKYEIIIVNDGSTDNTDEEVGNFIKNNPNVNIRYFYKENGGVSSARNFGLRVAKGYYIALLDSDDIWLPNKINTQLKYFKANEDIEFLGTNRNNEYHPYISTTKKIYKLTLSLLFLKWWPSTPTVMFKTDLIKKTGYYDENMKYAENGEFYYRVIKYSKLYVLNDSLLIKTFGDKGLSSNLSAMFAGEIKIIKSALKNKDLNIFTYIFFLSFLSLKYFRRVILRTLKI